MQICSNYSPNNFSFIFITIEYIIIIILLLLFIKKIYELCKFQNNSYDQIDIIIIYLSSLQLILFITRLIKNYNLFSFLISINKFSMNYLICIFLLIYILGQNEHSHVSNVKYFIIALLILDILIFFVEINYSKMFDIDNKDTIVDLIISIICLILDGFIWFKGLINKKEMNKNIIENNEPNKLSNIINKDEILIEEKNDVNSEKKEEYGFINNIYYQNLKNLAILITIYLYILFAFIITYLSDFILYFSNTSGIKSNDINNNNTTVNNGTMADNNINKNNNTEINNICIFSQITEEQFSLWKLILCFIIFFVRDIMPYLVIYFMIFYYRSNYYHRLSF